MNREARAKRRLVIVAGFLFANLLVFPVIALDGHVAFLSATILLPTLALYAATLVVMRIRARRSD